jgi:acetyl esterase/lipase
MRLPAVLAALALFTGCPSLQSFYRARDEVAVLVDVPYRPSGLHKHRLDLYRPRTSPTPWPVVVFVHGGYWRGGDKTYWQAITGLYGNAGIALGELGVGTVVTNYRLFPDVGIEDMLDDVVGAMLWARANVEKMGGDPDRIFLAGHSAGGTLVALLGSDPEALRSRGFDPAWLRGVVAISGIYDIAATIPLVHEELREEVFLPLFSADPARQRAASPVARFGAAMTPTLFLVGERDYRSSLRDYTAAEALLAPQRGERAWVFLIEGNEHADMVLELGTADDEVGPRIAAFVHTVESLVSR